MAIITITSLRMERSEKRHLRHEFWWVSVRRRRNRCQLPTTIVHRSTTTFQLYWIARFHCPMRFVTFAEALVRVRILSSELEFILVELSELMEIFVGATNAWRIIIFIVSCRRWKRLPRSEDIRGFVLIVIQLWVSGNFLWNFHGIFRRFLKFNWKILIKLLLGPREQLIESRTKNNEEEIELEQKVLNNL